ncbi:MAG: DUF5715 family protein [Bacteroidales bacterium]|nr:DUF5715 family protein [Bacteroidales bacterium]
MKVSQKRYIQGFGIVVVVLGMVRCVFPTLGTVTPVTALWADTVSIDTAAVAQLPVAEVAPVPNVAVHDSVAPLKPGVKSLFFNADGTPAKHRILSVPHFGNAFPDQNDVQLVSAQKWGVKPVKDSDEAEKRKAELVYVGANPYFHIDRLRTSIPYLVPSASVLLQDIGRTFFDSLQIKGVPLHKIIVTSILRSQKDVQKLRTHNGNATQNSCHMYGTTFDIAYNRYKTVQAPGEQRRQVRNDTLKWVLSEVLDDMRQAGRCYVKYEVKQGCFHITVR